jgi:2-polyprenyl-3-methyl-5-hydroxy-6-metoxy-1,4-benzoquinol methylase
MNSVLEKELFREQLYNYLLSQVAGLLPQWTTKEINHLVLRYFFIKKSDNFDIKKNPDPVFLIQESKLGQEQILNDLKFKKIPNAEKLAKQIVDTIEARCKRSVEKIQSTKFKEDDEIAYFEDTGEYEYRGKRYPNLKGSFPSQEEIKICNEYIALQIRYRYMGLDNQGLARLYREETGLLPNAKALEGFASGLNHYFDNYCSCFPDLELDSKGSFFDLDFSQYAGYRIYCNFPFDETLIVSAATKIIDYLTSHDGDENRAPTFICTLPSHWKDFAGYELLKNSRHTVQHRVYGKGELPFINYMQRPHERKLIYPCPIAEITLSTNSCGTQYPYHYNPLSAFIAKQEIPIQNLLDKLMRSGSKWKEYFRRNAYLLHSDPVVFEHLARLYKSNTSANATKEVDQWRANTRVKEFQKLFQTIKFTPQPNQSYLDFGSATGLLTSAIGKTFQFKTFATDVPIWHGTERKMNSDIQFKYLTQNKNDEYEIPFVNQQFDVISCLMVLHHIKKEKLQAAIANLVSHVKLETGVLILREHDVITQEDQDLCHIEHAMLDLVCQQRTIYQFNEDYYGHYRNSLFWTRLLEENGMKLIHEEAKPNSPTRYTYMLFKHVR